MSRVEVSTPYDFLKPTMGIPREQIFGRACSVHVCDQTNCIRLSGTSQARSAVPQNEGDCPFPIGRSYPSVDLCGLALSTDAQRGASRLLRRSAPGLPDAWIGQTGLADCNTWSRIRKRTPKSVCWVLASKVPQNRNNRAQLEMAAICPILVRRLVSAQKAQTVGAP